MSTNNFVDMIMTSADGTRTATVNSGMLINSSATTMSGVIDAQPGVPFAVDDEVYFDIPFTLTAGQYDWAIRGPDNIYTWNPMPGAFYRDNNKWSGQVLLMAAAEWGGDTSDLFGYIQRANNANTPSGYDMPGHHKTTWEQEFWDEHAATIFA